ALETATATNSPAPLRSASAFRYYRLTQEGRRGLRDQSEAWLGFHRIVEELLNKKGENGA
ncbi:hypothetical protein ACWEQU_17765, partial [Streptomyces nodosus]